LGPTYNEHAAALAGAGWQVETVAEVAALAGADLAVVVNPNNPDGRRHEPAALRALAAEVGLLVADESFADPHPELSLAPGLPGNAIVLRSFGKFYGLAGLRLGFALARADLAGRIAELAGPWAVSGPALSVGKTALADRDWVRRTTARLAAGVPRLDAAAEGAGWTTLGGTALFRLYETGDASAAQVRLARAQIWSRRFPYAQGWLRLGLPGAEPDWRRLEAVLSRQGEPDAS
jgi:cobalamin biosynthetic protein CobC